MEIIRYFPKGGMCKSCAKINNDCSSLDFKTMHVIDKDRAGNRFVRCSSFIRRTAQTELIGQAASALSDMIEYAYDLQGCWAWKKGERAGNAEEYVQLEQDIGKAREIYEALIEISDGY